MIRAQLYELLTHNISFDIPYYAENLTSKSSRILELGVGTGRTIAPLLQQGYSCTGIENDPQMIEYCTAKYKDVQIYNTDIRSFSIEERFDQIQAPLRVMHMLTQSERAASLSCIKEHLSPRGHAVFHVSSLGSSSFDGLWRSCSILPSSDGGEILIEESMIQNSSGIHILHRFQQISPLHHVTSTHITHTTLYFIDDFVSELEEIGFAAQILHKEGPNIFILAKVR